MVRAFAAETIAGSVKKTNQDAICFKEAVCGAESTIFAVVCDGVGGLQSGEVASSTVVCRLSEWFESQFEPHSKTSLLCGEDWREVVAAQLGELLVCANNDLFQYGERNGMRLGTTCSAMMISQETYIIAHVGDCRVYEIDTEAARCITQDQTLAARLMASGQIESEESVARADRHTILQAIGSQQVLKPVFYRGRVRSDAVYVLCTDGFRNRLSGEELQVAFNPLAMTDDVDARNAVSAQIQLVMQRKERDNISAIVFSAPVARSGV